MIRVARIFALTVAVVIGLGVESAHATFPGRNGRIAFSDGDPGQIYTMNPDGSKRKQVTHFGPGRGAASPSWSPNGKHIIFSVRRSHGSDDHSRVWVMLADGSHAHRVGGGPDGFGDRDPSYMADARHIVFFRSTPGFQAGSAIWKMRIDGTHQKALTPFSGSLHAAVDESPSASPEDNRIAFVRYYGDGIGARVFVMGSNGGNQHWISPVPLEAAVPDWSPDGKRIAFTSNGNHFFGSASFTMRADGTDVQRLTPSRYPYNDEGASYSPQGDQIIFASDRDYADFCCVDLFAISAAGDGEQRILTGSSSIGYPAWGTAPVVP